MRQRVWLLLTLVSTVTPLVCEQEKNFTILSPVSSEIFSLIKNHNKEAATIANEIRELDNLHDELRIKIRELHNFRHASRIIPYLNYVSRIIQDKEKKEALLFLNLLKDLPQCLVREAIRRGLYSQVSKVHIHNITQFIQQTCGKEYRVNGYLLVTAKEAAVSLNGAAWEYTRGAKPSELPSIALQAFLAEKLYEKACTVSKKITSVLPVSVQNSKLLQFVGNVALYLGSERIVHMAVIYLMDNSDTQHKDPVIG